MTTQLKPSDQLKNWSLKSVLDKAEPTDTEHFIYQIYSRADISRLEATNKTFLENYVRNPRKGLYSNKDSGYKGYNNYKQTRTGEASWMERESD